MNKKVLSAILFSALFAGTGTFTSCIDNDEPAGIEELRGAKAELIRAKVAVEQAQASLVLAQAEVEKAKAAKKLAEAEISKALAAINQAKADSINVKTEQERETLKQTIAKNQMTLDTLQLQHQIAMNKLKSSLAQSQRSYEIMLAQIEIAKAVGSSKDYVTISELQQAVKRAQRWVNRATDDMAEAQKDVDYWTAFDEAYKDLYKKNLETDVTDAEAGLAIAQAELAKWENYLENVESADWMAELADLNDTLAVIKKDTIDLRLEITKVEESAEYKALKKASEETAVAYVDSVYGYQYYDVQAGELKEFAKTLTYSNKNGDKYEGAKWEDTKKVDSLDAIKADLAASIALVKEQKTADSLEVLSFTAYKKNILDTIAAHADNAAATDSAEVSKIVKAWETALANYKAGKNFKVASVEAAAGTFITGMSPAAGETVVSKAAEEKALADFATALATAYGKLPAGQFEYAKFKLVKKASEAKSTLAAADYTEMTMGQVVADTEKGYYLGKVLAKMGLVNSSYDQNKERTVVELTKSGKNKTDYDKYLVTLRSDDNANGVFASFTQKELEGGLSGNIVENGDTTLYGKLVVASAEAFGDSKLYLSGDYTGENSAVTAKDKYYLTVKPTATDIEYVFTQILKDDYQPESGTESLYKKYGYLGKYGTSLTAAIGNITAYAKNYKAYLANLESAVAYWETSLAKLEKTDANYKLADAAADEAFNTYKLEAIKPLEDKMTILKKRAESINSIVEELEEAINLYLPGAITTEGATNPIAISDYKKLNDFLAARITDAKEAVKTAEGELAKAELELALFEQGKYNPTADAQAELDEAIAKLEKAQAKLDEALANLAKGLEIIAAVNAAE